MSEVPDRFRTQVRTFLDEALPPERRFVAHRLADMAVAVDQVEALVVSAVAERSAIDAAHPAVAELGLEC